MFIHSVFFWLKPEATAADAALRAALQDLLKIAGIERGYVGPPAATRDVVIEHGYNYGLTLMFADQAAHDRYQIDPQHLAFVERFKPQLAKVQVFDMEA